MSSNGFETGRHAPSCFRRKISRLALHQRLNDHYRANLQNSLAVVLRVCRTSGFHVSTLRSSVHGDQTHEFGRELPSMDSEDPPVQGGLWSQRRNHYERVATPRYDRVIVALPQRWTSCTESL
jgi:hypothetical protein